MINTLARLIRLDRPVPIWLLLATTFWGIAAANPTNPSLKILLIFGLGGFLMRSAGCIINDIFDRKIDLQVERTKNRPLATGEVSLPIAIAFLIFLLVLSLILLIQLSKLTIILGCLVLPLIVAYPLMKRITYWPQLFLGITYNWGLLMGFVELQQTLTLKALILFCAAILWTLGYDTIYAAQDMNEDKEIGVKSTAVLFGEHNKLIVSIIYAFHFVCLLFVVPHFWFMPLCAAHLIWQIYAWKPGENGLEIFRSNQWYGALVFITLIYT